jgi:nucleotide-binding universal stress UspA family protein
MTFQKILVPTDLSEEAESTFAQAVEFARVSHGTILLVSVVQEAVNLRMAVLSHAAMASPEIDQVAESLVERTRQKLEEKAAPIRARGVECRVIAVEGLSPARTVLDLALEESVDLIAIATHGRGGLKRFLLGSVAERIVREAPCPVLVMRAKVEKAAAPKS